MMKMSIRTILALIIVIMLAGPALANDKVFERKIIIFDKAINRTGQEKLISRFGSKLKSLRIINGAVASIPSNAVVEISRIPGVLNIENDLDVYATASLAISEAVQYIPWGVDRINADLAWPSSVGDGVKVAVLDSGIDLDHPDLAANVKGGFNAINHKKSVDDDCGHGTHVAGIIGAADNGLGVIGVSPGVDLYPIKILDSLGSGKVSNVIEGLQWCVDNHMQVANMSFGTISYSKAFQKAIKQAHDAGLIMVAAAGNRGAGQTSTVDYPAKFSEVIAVGATNMGDMLTAWSSRGSEVDIVAPGDSIYSTFNNGDYTTMAGTSMAAPHVTGAIALKVQMNPLVTPTQVLDLLKRTAIKLPYLTSEEQGASLADVYGLVLASN